MKKLKNLLIYYIFAYFSFIPLSNSAFEINARTAILQDFLSGEILYEKDITRSIYPASMTKIMTSIVVFDLLKTGDLNLEKFNTWLRKLLATQGPDIFRMKGVLSFADAPERFIFQGVHMLLDSKPDRLWEDSVRRNQLVFIGRNLDNLQIHQGFEECMI